MSLSYIVVFITLVVLILVVGVYKLNNMLLFHPYHASLSELQNFEHKTKDHFKKEIIITKDGIELYGGLYNSERMPFYGDIIFLYSHGNGGWIGSVVQSNTIKLLSKFGSVFIYDYRGYGVNIGNVTEENLYKDITAVWNFLIKKKNISSNKIILYGHSLGSAITSKLLHKITEQNKKLPKAMILEAPFISIGEMAKLFLPSLAFLCMYKFDNLYNISNSHEDVPICIVHSKTDEIIPYDHACIITEKSKCNLITIHGTHNIPFYTKDFDDWINKIL